MSRGVLNATALVVLYYVLPMDRRWDTDTALRLLIGLLVFAGLMVWQLRSIAGSRLPSAKSETARVVVIVQMLGDLAVLGAGVRVLVGAVRRCQQRRSGAGGGVGPGRPVTVSPCAFGLGRIPGRTMEPSWGPPRSFVRGDDGRRRCRLVCDEHPEP